MSVVELTSPAGAPLAVPAHAAATPPDVSSLLASRWFWAGGLASLACWTLVWLALLSLA